MFLVDFGALNIPIFDSSGNLNSYFFDNKCTHTDSLLKEAIETPSWIGNGE